MRKGKEGFEVLTEFLWRNDTHHFVVEFFEIVNIADIPWRDDHSGAKPSIDPRPSPFDIPGEQGKIEADNMAS